LTTTSHLVAAALPTQGAVAHNASGSNMPDGAVAALAQDRDTHLAVIEVDELHAVADAVNPAHRVLRCLLAPRPAPRAHRTRMDSHLRR
jgi:hypothetical protein